MPGNQPTQLKPHSTEEFLWDDRRIREVFTAAADTFVQKQDGFTQIWAASRDWFLEEWGRDTFIALPGILLVTGRFEEAKSVFRHFAEYEQNGLIPNRIQEDQILYNTVDGSMWYVQVLKKYVEYTKDWNLIEELFPVLKKIIQSYREGTHYERSGKTFHIFMDDDGLIVSPPQATWMDADLSGVGGQIVTPRNGKAVEINALWYANLLWMQDVCKKLKTDADCSKELKLLSQQVAESFNAKFWNEEEQCLLDVIEGDPHSGALRPNQIIAVSHGLNLLSAERQVQVLETVQRDLLTPGGLRTLSPRDSHYQGSYYTAAPMSEKDLAYHQGTVWPWLIGPYCDALVRVRKLQKKRMPTIRKELKQLLMPLVRFCLESEFQSLPEVFSGDPPHEPGGTTSQAWSVGEVFRVLEEYRMLAVK